MLNSSKFVFILVLSLCLSACAPKTPMPNINAEYYPQCFAPFKELQEHQSRLQRRVTGYTAAGVATGAAVGALTGLLTGNWRGAIAGAITGAVVGGLTGFNLAKIEEIKDENRRLVAYRDVIGADLVNATDVEITALRSLKCYVQEFERLQLDYAAQRITKEDFAVRYAEIKSGINELGKITGEAKTLMTQRDMEMRAAIYKESAKSNPNAEALPSLEQRRMERDRAAQAEIAKRKKSQRKQRKRKAPNLEEASSSIAMSELNAELDKLTAEAQADKVKYQEQKLVPPTSQAEKSSAAVVPVNIAQITAAYDQYPDKVLQMEAVEQQRLRTLEIMNEAAAKTGIDMV